MQVKVQILRGKGYPPMEDDLYLCTTQVMVSILSPDLETTLADGKYSSIQKNSNDPFYNDELVFTLSDHRSVDMIMLVKIMKHSQEGSPSPFLHGRLEITWDKFCSKKEVIVPLSIEEPVITPDQNRLHINRKQDKGVSSNPSLSLRVETNKGLLISQLEDVQDSEIQSDVKLCSNDILVPTACEYVWLRFLIDKKWNNMFRFHLLATFRGQPTLKSKPEGNCKPSTLAKGVNGTDINDLQSVGDVIINKWGCFQIRSALTKLCLAAQKFCRGETSLIISNEEEENFSIVKKRRGALLSSLWYDSMRSYGSEGLRNCLDSLWLLFITGIDPTCTSKQNLIYEAREKVHQATFDKYSAVILLSSLLHFLVPSISYEAAEALAITDIRSKKAFQGFILEDTELLKALELESSITRHQLFFCAVLLFFLTYLMDTVTETESLKVLKLFINAIVDAHKRNSESAKEFIRQRVNQITSTPRRYGIKGNGIPIEHLDKYGHRNVSLKFT